MLIRELPAELRPTVRLQDTGPAALSSTELLSILIGSGTQENNAIRLAETLLAQFDGLRNLALATPEELCQVRGIGPAKVAKIQAGLQLGLRLSCARHNPQVQATMPSVVASMLMPEMSLLETEHLRVAMLDNKSYIQHVHTVYTGSINAIVVRIGEIFREPIRRLSASIVLVHNHPSGDPTPSPEDVRVTEMVVEAGKLLDIKVLDHIVIGGNRYVSLKERGLGFKV